MSPSEVLTMSTLGIVNLFGDAHPAGEALAWLSSVIADPAKVAGVNELSRRYQASRETGSIEGRARAAGSVLIDADKFKHSMWRRRIPLKELGPMIGRSEGLASVLAYKGRINYYTCDEMARAIGIHVDAFIAEIAAPEELERLGV